MLATGLLALYQLTSEGAWLTAATGLLDTAVAHFGDPQRPGRWFDTADDAERLMLRPSDPLDGATPSGASSIAEALLTAGHVVDGARAERYWQLAADTLRAHAVLLARAPRSAGHWLAVAEAWCADRCRSPSRATCRGRPCWPTRAGWPRAGRSSWAARRVRRRCWSAGIGWPAPTPPTYAGAGSAICR